MNAQQKRQLREELEELRAEERMVQRHPELDYRGDFVEDYPAARIVPAGDSYRAFQILHIAFVVVPLIAGLDKFAHLLVNWDQYLSPQLAHLSPFGAHNTMLIAGAIEILAGIVVATMPRIGGWLVAVWLWLIAANLLLMGSFYDIALRDFGLSLGAVALAMMAPERVFNRLSRRPLW